MNAVTKMMTVDPVDDIRTQARHGSVAAIIQVLNDKLADTAIRTRAVFEHGVLQLLCEAETPQQMEQPELVSRIRQILESIEPKGIRKVNISSRIVREQQLLWLEEISRDPEAQLLWSELITLRQPSFLQRFLKDVRQNHRETAPLPQTPSVQKTRQLRSFWRGIVGGASLSLLLLVVGWAVKDWVGHNWWHGSNPGHSTDGSSQSPGDVDPALSTEQPTVETPPPKTNVDPFAKAVRLAERAALDGQVAESSAEWLDLAARWQQASDLMGTVQPDDERYQTAQDRTGEYEKNSKTALDKAANIP